MFSIYFIGILEKCIHKNKLLKYCSCIQYFDVLYTYFKCFILQI